MRSLPLRWWAWAATPTPTGASCSLQSARFARPGGLLLPDMMPEGIELACCYPNSSSLLRYRQHQSASKSLRPAAGAGAGDRMGLKHRQARPRPARCTLCQRSQAEGSPGGVRSAWDLLAGGVRRLHDRDPNGPAAYVTSRAALTGVPWRAARARLWPRLPRSTRPRSWRRTCKCAAGPLPALTAHLCRPLQVGAFAPTDACIRQQCGPLHHSQSWGGAGGRPGPARRWHAGPGAPAGGAPGGAALRCRRRRGSPAGGAAAAAGGAAAAAWAEAASPRDSPPPAKRSEGAPLLLRAEVGMGGAGRTDRVCTQEARQLCCRRSLHWLCSDLTAEADLLGRLCARRRPRRCPSRSCARGRRPRR